MATFVQRSIAVLLFISTASLIVSLGAGLLLGHGAESVMANNNCELPCAFGVTPGVTDRATAEQTYQRIAAKPASFLTQLQYSFSLRVMNVENASSSGSDGLALALVQFQKPIGGDVRAVRLYEMSLQLWQLGDLLLTEEQPDRVFASCDAAHPKMLLTIGDDTIAEVSPTERLTPEMEINRIALTADMETTLVPLLASFNCFTETTWQGFAPFWRYLAGV